MNADFNLISQHLRENLGKLNVHLLKCALLQLEQKAAFLGPYCELALDL